MQTRFFRRAGTSGVRAHGRKKGWHAGSSGVRKAFAACSTQSSDGMRRTKMPESRIFTAAIQASRSDGCRYASALSTKSGRKTEIRKTSGKQPRTHRRLSETAQETQTPYRKSPAIGRAAPLQRRVAGPPDIASPSPSVRRFRTAADRQRSSRRPERRRNPPYETAANLRRSSSGTHSHTGTSSGTEIIPGTARNYPAEASCDAPAGNREPAPEKADGKTVRLPGSRPPRRTARRLRPGICRHAAGADRTPATIRPSGAFPAPRRNSRRNFLSLHK